MFPSPAVELTIEDLLPGAKVKTTACDSNHAFTAEKLTFDVSITVILTSAVVEVLWDWGVRDYLLEERLEVLVKSALYKKSEKIH